MARVLQTSAAKLDLLEIVDTISLDNPSAANNWLREIEWVLELLATQPLLGEEYCKGRARLRRHSHKNYVIYYRPLTDGILVMRVLHDAREPRGLL